uniref:U3 small nucleolar ribonucleoprotein protein MPP10 n=1 Tax=Entomoneis paludosa TaxID=265537 RepID=A0A7S3DYA6_9STRA|mmetsp:Transcript_8036/g.16759  ORF Transcript_8036/g.16759 Transcript_8036/m.16759 type:complete len:757 (+) Transcript_8036:37-2307(+)
MEDFLESLKKPEGLGVSLVGRNEDTEQRALHRKQLQQVCQLLFRRVERLGKLYNERIDQNVSGQALTGIDELYLGSGDGAESGVAEMVYGQVEVQNDALRSLLKKANKRLTKSIEAGKDIRLLEDMESEDEEDPSVSEEEGENDEIDAAADDDDAEESDEQRIRSRMERVMDDMSDEEEEEEDDSNANTNTRADIKEMEESEIVDPIAEGLKDGFFDLNEMEAFADEEEEYLPEEAFGEEKPEKPALKDDKSLHQKLREGNLDEDSDEDSEDDDLLVRKETTVKRKRYREDDEIDALYKLYEKPQSAMDSDDDDEDDVVNMTAADIFGKPQKKYYDRWYSGSGKDSGFDAEEFNMEAELERMENDNGLETDQESKGREDNEKDADSSDEENDEEDEADYGENDEEVPMKDDGTTPAAPERPAPKGPKQEKLRKQIDQLEKDMISEKPWQMKGEVQATARPMDSLLESTPEFEVAAKQAPVITVEHTADLEDIIKKRILDEDWDDVIPRELPDVAWNKKKGELPEVSQEKSKLGLGELYEREYLKKAVGYDVDAAEKESEEEKVKNEMKTLFANLCSKLDALSNYHFAPRPVAEEAEVRAVAKPAIAMEEVLPLHVSDARGVAPEEVYGSKRGRDGVLRGDTELDQQDRKRLRSAKKAARRKNRKEKLADDKLISRLQPGLGLNNPYEKRKMREELSAARARGKVTTGEVDNNSYGKSTTFFKRMQSEAQDAIRAKSDPTDSEKGKKDRGNSSALKL